MTDDWGPGAYVTAALYRPMDVAAKRMPARALGLTWAKVSPGDRDLAVSLDLPDEMRPRGPMTIPVSIGNLKPGEQAYVTVAAVDVGILNLTNFKAPAPDDWYFGQRTLGVEIRDIYGLLIDRMQGVPGAVRSGGDSDGGAPEGAAADAEAARLLFRHRQRRRRRQGVRDLRPARLQRHRPRHGDGVDARTASATPRKDVFVRDPVVVTASIPRFLAIGDTSRLLVEVNNVSGPAGDYRLSVATGEGIGLADARRDAHARRSPRSSAVGQHADLGRQRSATSTCRCR